MPIFTASPIMCVLSQGRGQGQEVTKISALSKGLFWEAQLSHTILKSLQKKDLGSQREGLGGKTVEEASTEVLNGLSPQRRIYLDLLQSLGRPKPFPWHSWHRG